jgi:hypothetical protein
MTYSVPVGLGSLATAEVAKGPGGVPEHAQLAAVSQEGQERLQGTAAEDVVAAVGAVASDIAEGPHGLLANIGLGASEKLDENRNGAGLDDDLGLRGGARSNVGQGPSRLELDQGVGRAKELDKAANDARLDDLLNRGVALLGQKLSELGCRLDLKVDLLGEDALDHLRQVLVQLRSSVSILIQQRTEKNKYRMTKEHMCLETRARQAV